MVKNKDENKSEEEKIKVGMGKVGWEVCGWRVFVKKEIGILVEIQTYYS